MPGVWARQPPLEQPRVYSAGFVVETRVLDANYVDKDGAGAGRLVILCCILSVLSHAASFCRHQERPRVRSFLVSSSSG